MTTLAEGVLKRWQREQGVGKVPAYIISDDYGLAAQVRLAWKARQTKLILPQDGIFHRSMPSGSATNLGGAALVLSVHRSDDETWERLIQVKSLGSLDHPITGLPVNIGISNGALVVEK